MARTNYTIMTLKYREYQYNKCVDTYRVLYINLKAK